MEQITSVLGTACLALLVLAAGGAVFAWFRVRKRVREISRAAFGTDSLAEGLERQADLLAETPKSVMGMTKVCLPQIEEDFPEFDWARFRQKCENTLKAYLVALEKLDVAYLGEASAPLRRQAELQIEEIRRSGRTESYRQVKVHKTEIARYVKREGLCIVGIQSAVEYYHDVGGEQAVRKDQVRYNLEMIYVQDVTKVKEYATSVGVTCPNCGAPITRLGSKYCEYCKSAVTPVNDKVWMLHRIEKEV